MPTSVKIDDIEVDDQVTFRDSLDEETVKRYEETIDALPAIKLVEVEGKLLLADGFHRLQALKNLERTDAIADVVVGDRTTAIIISAVDNTKHGRPMSREERNRAIIYMVEQGWTNQDVARVFAISPTLVSKIAVDAGERRRPEGVQQKATRTRKAKTAPKPSTVAASKSTEPTEPELEPSTESTDREPDAAPLLVGPSPKEEGATPKEEGATPNLDGPQTPLEASGDRMNVSASLTANQWVDLLAAAESNSAYPEDYGLAEIGVREIRRILSGLGLD